MTTSIDWISIEGEYRADISSLREIGAKYGITEGAIRKRAKRDGWLRDPEGVKRQMVRAALTCGTRAGTQYATDIIAEEAEQDVEDMRAGLGVARRCIRKLAEMVELAIEPKDIKVIAEANRIAVETIRRIRGLDDVANTDIVITNPRRQDA